MISTDDLKLYLRVDSDAEDELIESLQEMAIEYLAQAGVAATDGARYDTAIKGLVLHYYDHRDDGAAFGYGLQALINQLKWESN